MGPPGELRLHLVDPDRPLEDLDEQLEHEVLRKMQYVHRAFEMSCFKTQIVLLRINFLCVNSRGRITKCVSLDQSKAHYIKKSSDILPTASKILDKFRQMLLDQPETFDKVGESFFA